MIQNQENEEFSIEKQQPKQPVDLVDVKLTELNLEQTLVQKLISDHINSVIYPPFQYQDKTTTSIWKEKSDLQLYWELGSLLLPTSKALEQSGERILKRNVC